MANGLESLGVTQREIDAILSSDEVTAEKLALAEKVKAAWRALSPVLTGRYRDSIEVSVGPDNVVRVTANADYASYLEYGTSDTREMALRSQVEARFANRD